MRTTLLSQPLTLPCGVQIPNRIAKAAMTEGLATPQGHPSAELARLYGLWSKGGAGLLISGNILIDGDHLERPGNVIVEGNTSEPLAADLRAWTQKATKNGNQFWAQLSHAGRQTQKLVNPNPKAPSAVKLGLPGGQFGMPVALKTEEIEELVNRFADAALICKENGFSGVQVHAAHGYLLSSFLSPLANQRHDHYGGSLQNRARFLLNTVNAVRKKVGDHFPVSVKLNSADFQKGGFAFKESLQVASWLSDAGIDLLEISGGNYEQPKLLGLEGLEPLEKQNVAPSTAAREAYFVDFAFAMREQVNVPLMVTGGFRSRAAMEQCLSTNAADFVGLARPLCTLPNGPNRLFDGLEKLPTYENELRLIPALLSSLRRFQTLKTLDGFAVQYWFYGQLISLAKSGKMNPDLKPFSAMLQTEKLSRQWMKERRKVLPFK